MMNIYVDDNGSKIDKTERAGLFATLLSNL